MLDTGCWMLDDIYYPLFPDFTSSNSFQSKGIDLIDCFYGGMVPDVKIPAASRIQHPASSINTIGLQRILPSLSFCGLRKRS